jgi:exopolysaccharide biosynthesis polyprenyl glycosylphosphotransferase
MSSEGTFMSEETIPLGRDGATLRRSRSDAAGQRSAHAHASALKAAALRPFVNRNVQASRVEGGILLAADLGALAFSLTILMIVPGLTVSGGVVAYAIAVPLFLSLGGMYQQRIDVSFLGSLPKFAGLLALPLLLLFTLEWFLGPYSTTLLTYVGIAAGVLVATRGFGYTLIRLLRRRRLLADRTLIVGTGQTAVELAQRMSSQPEHGLEPVGFVGASRDVASNDVDELPHPLLGGLRDVRTIATSAEVDRVVIAFGGVREADWIVQVRDILRQGLEVNVVPRFFELGVEDRVSTNEVVAIPLQRLRPFATYRPSWAVKRALDLFAASAALVLLSPLLAVVALAVRSSSPGPVLFRQTRVGKDGQSFELLKFRSMRTSHRGDQAWSVQGHESDMTRVGAFIRRTSLDELPQLWNVLKGEMSLVGPRPERRNFVDRFSKEIPGYRDRHRLPVGLTGWAQVNGLRGNTSIPERVRFDNYYIDRWSFWFDVVILMKTVRAVVSGFVNETVQ